MASFFILVKRSHWLTMMLAWLSLVLGYVSRYRSHEPTRQFVLKVMALSLLPPEIIADGFKMLEKLAQSKEAKSFMAYYQTHWLVKWGAEHYSVFKKKVRTNNDMEGLYIVHMLCRLAANTLSHVQKYVNTYYKH